MIESPPVCTRVAFALEVWAEHGAGQGVDTEVREMAASSVDEAAILRASVHHSTSA